MHGDSMRKEKYIEHKHKVMYDGGANDPSQVRCMMIVIYCSIGSMMMLLILIDPSGCMMYEGLTQTTH